MELSSAIFEPVLDSLPSDYLGEDLNRSFHQSDESIYPEVVALKEFAKTLKRRF